MIKAYAEETVTGRQLLLIGLSKANVERMQAGDPIYVTLDDVAEAAPQLMGMDLTIVFGEDEYAITQNFIQAGALRPDDVRLANHKGSHLTDQEGDEGEDGGHSGAST